MATRYELRFTASGEVRDADGNVIGTQPIEGTRIVTEAEALAILERSATAEKESTS